MTLHWWDFGRKTSTNPMGTVRGLYLMSAALRASKKFALAGLAVPVFAQNAYPPQGSEYPLAGLLPGDQVNPQLALNSSGGYLVWQDNTTDGDGVGISARRINSSLSGTLGVFRVNEKGAGDQLNPRVAMLKNGGAVFAWQSGASASRIYARFLKPDGTFATGDVLVNTY